MSLDNLVIETENLTRVFKNVVAVDGLSLKVQRGEIFGLVGPDGAGKTTTIRCILDMIRPQAGTIRVHGVDPQKDPLTVHNLVGYLPGELNVEANLRVKSALRYFTELRGNQVEWDYVRQLAQRLELDLDMQIKNLSKGNKQKVGLVQALMHKPKLLLMDEPSLGLSPMNVIEIAKIVREFNEMGISVILVEQNVRLDLGLAKAGYVLETGSIILHGEAGELMHSEHVKKAYLGQ